MHLRTVMAIIALGLTRYTFALPWEPAAISSFEALAGAEDGSILLARYPGATESIRVGQAFQPVMCAYSPCAECGRAGKPGLRLKA